MKYILAISLFFLTQSVYADSLKSLSETKKLSDSIVQHFVKEQFETGLGMAKKYWPLPEVEIDGLAITIKTQWGGVRNRYGRTTGSEFLGEQKIGHSFVRYYYLHKFENHAMYWRITFYKPKDVWVINGITYRDELDILFE